MPCLIFLQASPHSEKERAYDSERKFAEAQITGEERQKKLKEAEGKVTQSPGVIEQVIVITYF